MALDIGIEEIEKTLMKKEKEFDKFLSQQREVVRSCSNAIKCMHAYDMAAAKQHMKEAEKGITELRELADDRHSHINHVLQEYAEAKIVLSAIDKKTIPSFKELDMPIEPYLTGLLDAIGELKRELLESLRRGNKHEAEQYFKLMDGIYDSLLPIRFSNSVLPEFRRKQDSARFQVEQARAELL